MVKLIHNPMDAHGENYLVFKVYKNPEDENIYGYLIPHSTYDKDGKLLSVGTERDMIVTDALPKAIDAARDFGVNMIWVQDLDHLFPKDEWPLFPDLPKAA